jgi:hypothetical protein
VDEDVPPPTDPTEARVFSQVISGLQKSYPRDKMEEISTSFCFICLLHLANEQGLKLESTADGMARIEVEVDDDISTEDKKIGNIWDLKVLRAQLFLLGTVADMKTRLDLPRSQCNSIRLSPSSHVDVVIAPHLHLYISLLL